MSEKKEKEFVVPVDGSYQKVIEFILEQSSRVFLLEGSLGAGKTTFTANFVAFLENLQATDLYGRAKKELGVMSPTFSIFNEYKLNKSTVLHADFYRLKERELDLEEILETIEAADYSFIEWATKIPSLKENLSNFIEVSIFKDESNENETADRLVKIRF